MKKRIIYYICLSAVMAALGALFCSCEKDEQFEPETPYKDVAQKQPVDISDKIQPTPTP